MKSKEEIITDMCYTYRHDYGLRKSPEDPSWTSGMTEEDAKMLYKVMEQIYNNDIEPLLKQYYEIYLGDKVVLPKDVEHAEAMVKVGMFYLETQNVPKQNC
jgi:hypothetical protein